MKINYQKIKNTRWYRQGGAICPYYPSLAYRLAFQSFDGFNFYQNNNNYGYFDKNKMRVICDNLIKEQIKNKICIKRKLIGPWQKAKQKQDRFNKKITEKYLSQLSDKEFFSIHRRFSDWRLKIWRTGIMIEAFDPWSEVIVNEYLDKYNLKIKLDDLAILVGPNKLSFNQCELLDRFQIIKDYKSNKDIKLQILKHSRKYHWIENSWAEVKYLNEKHFEKLVKKDAQQEIKLINRQIRELNPNESRIKKKKFQLIKKYKLPLEMKNLFYFFSLMSDWRDQRKEQVLKTNRTAELFINELVKRTGISKRYLFFLDACEVKNISYLKRIKKNLKKRSTGFFYWITKNGIQGYTGQKARKLNQLLEKQLVQSEEIKGVVANKGKAIGPVKIVITSSDFKKIRRGDILVTQMTRPEFIPIIHKAKAIITDEGGITCHAAIISRELGIPCIIGTQVASSVLKDGDLVEVDADKGVVRKMK
ncbi:MAG: PEP-utilizing enzyme [Candidatus Kuenenbacteria bacterium]